MEKLNQIIEDINSNIEIKSSKLIINDLDLDIYYHRVTSDIKLFNQFYVNKINSQTISILDKIYPGIYMKVILIDDFITSSINNGFIFLFYDNYLYLVNVQANFNRSIQDSLIDGTNIESSRDGFIESMDTNIALIQKRIKANCLNVETLTIGKRSKTLVSLLYIKDIVRKDKLKMIYDKLNSITTDGICSIKDITYLFTKNSIFPKCAEIGNPDIACSCLYEGRILIIIDGFPVLLTLPVDFNYFITLKENHYTNVYVTLYYRIIFTLLLFISVFFLGLYVALINYHSEALSLVVISQIKSSFRGSTLPLIIEFIFILFLFDTLRLASTKAVNNNIQSVIVIVGGLLIGQNAVESGFISAFNLVITAICYLSSYAISNNQKFIQGLSFLRIIVFLAGIFLGIYGVILISIIILHYLTQLKSLDTVYTSPLIPTYKKDLMQSFFSKRIYKTKERNKNLNPIDKERGNL